MPLAVRHKSKSESKIVHISSLMENCTYVVLICDIYCKGGSTHKSRRVFSINRITGDNFMDESSICKTI